METGTENCVIEETELNDALDLMFFLERVHPVCMLEKTGSR